MATATTAGLERLRGAVGRRRRRTDVMRWFLIVHVPHDRKQDSIKTQRLPNLRSA
jgi:hypothetical protein